MATPVARRVRIREPNGMSSSRRSLSSRRASPDSTTHSRDCESKLRAGEQTQLTEHHRRHLLGLIDEDDGPSAGRAEVVEPARAQRLEPAPAIAHAA